MYSPNNNNDNNMEPFYNLNMSFLEGIIKCNHLLAYVDFFLFVKAKLI